MIEQKLKQLGISSDEFSLKLDVERKNLEAHLKERFMSPAGVSTHLKVGAYNNLLEEITFMGAIADEAATFAKGFDVDKAVKYLAVAKRQKDNVYMSLMEGVGGIKNLHSSLDNQNIVALKDYIMNRYDSAVTRCEMLLGVSA